MTTVDLQKPVSHLLHNVLYKQLVEIFTLIASAMVGAKHFPSSKYNCKYCSFSQLRRRSGFPKTRRSALTTDRRPAYKYRHKNGIILYACLMMSESLLEYTPVSQIEAKRGGKTKKVERLSLKTIPKTREMQVSGITQCSMPYLSEI
jgi:hypothetical protein